MITLHKYVGLATFQARSMDDTILRALPPFPIDGPTLELDFDSVTASQTDAAVTNTTVDEMLDAVLNDPIPPCLLLEQVPKWQQLTPQKRLELVNGIFGKTTVAELVTANIKEFNEFCNTRGYVSKTPMRSLLIAMRRQLKNRGYAQKSRKELAGQLASAQQQVLTLKEQLIAAHAEVDRLRRELEKS